MAAAGIGWNGIRQFRDFLNTFLCHFLQEKNCLFGYTDETNFFKTLDEIYFGENHSTESRFFCGQCEGKQEQTLFKDLRRI